MYNDAKSCFLQVYRYLQICQKTSKSNVEFIILKLRAKQLLGDGTRH